MESEPLLPHDDYAKEHKRQVRLGFVRKVMGIVSAQVIFTVAIVYLILTLDKTSELSNNPLLIIPAFIGYIFIACALICCKSIARKVPTNFILLFTLTACLSFILAFICEFYTTWSLINALIITVFVTVGLTAFTLVYKVKMTYIVGGIVVVILGLITTLVLFFGNYVLTGTLPSGLLYFYYFLGVLLYGLFLVFDVKRLTKKKYGLDVDDYVFAALMIYLDIVNLFLEILKLVGQKK